jgi:hypothetical protein
MEKYTTSTRGYEPDSAIFSASAPATPLPTIVISGRVKENFNAEFTGMDISGKTSVHIEEIKRYALWKL